MVVHDAAAVDDDDVPLLPFGQKREHTAGGDQRHLGAVHKGVMGCGDGGQVLAGHLHHLHLKVHLLHLFDLGVIGHPHDEASLAAAND